MVRLKFAVLPTPGALAAKAKEPVWPLAVSAGAVAMPLAFVVAVVVADPLKVALAPLAGAANVTVTPPNGLLPASFTVACSAVANMVFTVAL